MRFGFEKDYLQDLEPVLACLASDDRLATIAEIDTCKSRGSTGGEILSCICSSLREARRDSLGRFTRQAVEDYLRKAGPGY